MCYTFPLKINSFKKSNADDFIVKVIDNQEIVITKEWWDLINHYEVNLPLVDLLKITFIECHSKVLGLKCGNLMVFSKPILRENGYFVIPGFTHFVINSEGCVISTRHGRKLKPSIGPYGYPYVNLYDADKKRWRSVAIHILVARTFVKNTDLAERVFVNHKDGNKTNFKSSNLEWVTSSENNKHAVDNALRNDNIRCLVRNIKTLEIIAFPSIGSALTALGFVSKSESIVKNVNGKIIPKLFNKQYEIKLLSDTSDWFYTSEIIDYQGVKQVGPFEALSIADKKIYEDKTIIGLSRQTGISEYKITSALNSTLVKSVSGFLFRSKTELAWPTSFKETVHAKPRKIEITNLITGEKHLFASIRKVTKFLGIDKRTLKDRLVKKTPYKNWNIEEIVN